MSNEQVDAFLPRETRDHADERSARRGRLAQQVEQRLLVQQLARQVRVVVAMRQVLVRRRIPLVVVHAVQYPDHGVAAPEQVAVEAMPSLGRADLGGVRRAHRGDRVRIHDAVAHRVDASRAEVGLVQCLDRDAGAHVAGMPGGEDALVADVVDREDAARRAENAFVPTVGVAQQQRREGRVPVVRMQDVRREGHALAALEGRPRQCEVAHVLVGRVGVDAGRSKRAGQSIR